MMLDTEFESPKALRQSLPDSVFEFADGQVVTMKEWMTHGTLLPRPLIVSGQVLIKEGGRVVKEYVLVDHQAMVQVTGVAEGLLVAYPDVPLPATHAAHLALVLQQGIIAKTRASQAEAVAAGSKEQEKGAD